jgi:hypothetical protein
VVGNMPKKENAKDVKVIIQYEKNIDGKEEKSLQKIIQKLFNSYINKVTQDINKGKKLFPNI